MLPILRHRLGDDLLDRFFEENWTKSEIATYYPKLDVHEDKDNVYVKADLPGLDRKDVKVTLKDNILSIKGDRTEEKRVEKDNFYRFERFSGKFERSVYLPDEVDGSKIKAEAKDGVLNVVIPKAEHKKEKEISIDIK